MKKIKIVGNNDILVTDDDTSIYESTPKFEIQETYLLHSVEQN